MREITLFLVYLIQFTHGFILPPQPDNAALMARYIIHNTGWVSLGTISTQKNIVGYPFITLKSFSDGMAETGTGIPYLYMTDMDVSGKDVKINNKVTIMASLAEENYCSLKNFDPQDPRCAKVMITGKIIKVNDKIEYEFGKKALFDKHPSMKSWPIDHKFYVAKIDIFQIEVLDFFGGIKHVTNEDYFHPNVTFLDYFPEVKIIDVIA
ncbi:unnamed protein product [Brassicogethes aeneus]|uniref:CREG-like beta-barrel domain-containing protein n=1 Tax=Brassicogethes aeneus TaxID=1431903 RepID=A0A9P0B832_BRAAE|nr:unnamed protein product [Brassicogethes aeneus]